MIEVYAITDHPAPPLPDLVPLRHVASGGLAAVFTTASDEETTPESLAEQPSETVSPSV